MKDIENMDDKGRRELAAKLKRGDDMLLRLEQEREREKRDSKGDPRLAQRAAS